MVFRLPKAGDRVNVIEKRNYENGKLTTGVVSRLLSNPQEVHPRGNKVELKDGTVGRMVSFVDEVGAQTFVDPSEREKYAAEVRTNRPEKPHFEKRERGNFERRPREERVQVEKPISAADIPGVDDLR